MKTSYEFAVHAAPPTAYCLLPLPTAYCLLPTAYCLLPTAYYSTVEFFIVRNDHVGRESRDCYLAASATQPLSFTVVVQYAECRLRHPSSITNREQVPATTLLDDFGDASDSRGDYRNFAGHRLQCRKAE